MEGGVVLMGVDDVVNGDDDDDDDDDDVATANGTAKR